MNRGYQIEGAARPLKGVFYAAVMFVVSLLFLHESPSFAAGMPLSVVSGSFVYEVAVAGEQSSAISYRVEATEYHGVRAWRIAWSDARMEAEHLISQKDGAPLYTQRINYRKHERVEVQYSLDPSRPHIYRRERRDETLVRRIHEPGLVDLGSLPQVLLGLQAGGNQGELHFKAIDYSDGSVYALLAKRVGYTTLNTQGRQMPCALYEANLDSWKAAFNPAIKLQVPTQTRLTNFATYAGPDPAGGGKTATLRMISSSSEVAVLSLPERTMLAH